MKPPTQADAALILDLAYHAVDKAFESIGIVAESAGADHRIAVYVTASAIFAMKAKAIAGVSPSTSTLWNMVIHDCGASIQASVQKDYEELTRDR